MKPIFSYLKHLCELHSTSGDEGEVIAFLHGAWSKCGWAVESFGRYALTARSPEWQDGRPTLMFCAHADSPGLIIDTVKDGFTGTAVKIGGVQAPKGKASCMVKLSAGVYEECSIQMTQSSMVTDAQVTCSKPVLHRGQRVCFKPRYRTVKGEIHATFLDNRVGCAALCALADAWKGIPHGVNVILAVTANEEFAGFGASVLANSVKADCVVCLDGTYENEEQGVACGGGPVLTVSDKSTVLSPAVVAGIAEYFATKNIPLQTEIYNYSGTDARAFPIAGVFVPVVAILVATTGNHSPCETATVKDVEQYGKMLETMSADASFVDSMKSIWHF